MAVAYDFLLDSKGNLLIQNGDLVVGPSDAQHVADTINAFPGWWKQYPNDGVGISSYYKARIEKQDLINKMRQQLENDGYRLFNPTVTMIDNKLTVNPDAKRI